MLVNARTAVHVAGTVYLQSEETDMIDVKTETAWTRLLDKLRNLWRPAPPAQPGPAAERPPPVAVVVCEVGALQTLPA